MTNEIIFHVIEIAVLGIPLWWGAIRLYFIVSEYPPHRHEEDRIIYPRGMEPGKTVIWSRSRNERP